MCEGTVQSQKAQVGQGFHPWTQFLNCFEGTRDPGVCRWDKRAALHPILRAFTLIPFIVQGAIVWGGGGEREVLKRTPQTLHIPCRA